MAATVMLLLLLVLITPRLIGVREDISSLPRLILNYGNEDFVAFVTSLSGTYLYSALYLNITPRNGPNSAHYVVNDSHALEGRIGLEGSSQFNIEAVAVDQRRVFFDISVDVEASRTAKGWSFTLRLSGETTPRVLTENDISNTPFATLMQRRTS